MEVGLEWCCSFQTPVRQGQRVVGDLLRWRGGGVPDPALQRGEERREGSHLTWR